MTSCQQLSGMWGGKKDDRGGGGGGDGGVADIISKGVKETERMINLHEAREKEANRNFGL